MTIRPTNDRGVFEVSSQSGDEWHRVDAEEMTCSCSRVMEFADTVCPHLEAIFQTRAAEIRQLLTSVVESRKQRP